MYQKPKPKKYLTDTEIEKAKKHVNYRDHQPFHQHNDCIRIAYEWLDAQTKLKNKSKSYLSDLKRAIEEWGGRYVSISDVLVAIHLHPEISISSPNSRVSINISKKWTLPSLIRLQGIKEAFAHKGYELNPSVYFKKEDD